MNEFKVCPVCKKKNVRQVYHNLRDWQQLCEECTKKSIERREVSG